MPKSLKFPRRRQNLKNKDINSNLPGSEGLLARKISTSVQNPEWQGMLLSTSLNDNLHNLKQIFAGCTDIIYREFALAQNKNIRLAIVFSEALADKTRIAEYIIRPLSMEVPLVISQEEIDRAHILDFIKNRGQYVLEMSETNRVEIVVNGILAGNATLLIDGQNKVVNLDVKGWEMRNITSSEADRSVRGPREAFVETLLVNISMLRRRIKNPALKFEKMIIGRLTRTDIALAYVEGIADPRLLTEVKERLARIDIDNILESGQIEELIEDNPFSPFCTINHTDRVDKVAAQILEGRLAVLVDGTPFALTLPALFMEITQTPEDYYQRYNVGSLARLIRWAAIFIVMTISPLYVAISIFDPELLPTPFLLNMAAQRDGLPFTILFEIITMELVFEVLRESSLRMPLPMGQAVSIVGTLVLGEVAVRAGLVGSVTVIVTAISGIASFAFCYGGSLFIRLLRFPLILVAGVMGLYGFVLGIFTIMVHLASLRSFGVPFLSPVTPFSFSGQKDLAIRAPWWAMLKRPRQFAPGNRQREKEGLKPHPPKRY